VLLRARAVTAIDAIDDGAGMKRARERFARELSRKKGREEEG
jgi:hypothetical protein